MQIPAFDVVDDDDEDSIGHPRRHPDHPLSRPSLASFARRTLSEPLPAHFGWSTGCSSSRPSPRATIVSDPGSACKIDARTVLNPGDTSLLTSTSSPAILRFDTDVCASPFNVPECALHPSRRPSSSPVTPPPSSPSTASSTSSTTLPTSLTSTPSAPSSLSWTSSRRRSLNPGASPLDDAAHASDVALLDALDAALIVALALCVDALIERRRVRRAWRQQLVGDDLDECLPSSGVTSAG
ncbi:hypothetical protein EV714DRAFT_276211 [Schizophyllum commune]